MSRREVIAAGAALTAAPAIAKAKPESSGAAGLLDTQDALGLAELVRKRQVSATELLDAAIARTEAVNPKLNFLARPIYKHGRDAIARGLPDGPFTGVPWLIKDLNLFIAGEITAQGSRYYAGNRATVTSELVRRYEAAGLVIFGQTATPEFGLSPTTESLATGPTRNPWNPAHIAGGSSGGAAVAVASGVIPAAHATDGGGSIRIPASCCGLFGLKPSRGRTPMGPRRTEGWGGLSTAHAISRSVRDSAALLDATCGIEPGSRYGAPTPVRPFLSEVARDPRKLRIALSIDAPAGTPIDPECRRAAEDAARLLERLGHIVEIASPKLDIAAIGRASFAIISTAVAADLADRAKATGIAIGPDVLEPVTLAFNQVGLTTPGIDVARAHGDLQAAAYQTAVFMERFDIILSPTLASPPPRIGTMGPARPVQEFFAAAAALSPYTALQNQTGQPSMSVPLGMSADGLPIGVLFSARYGEDATLFALAGQLERAAPWAGRRPPRI